MKRHLEEKCTNDKIKKLKNNNRDEYYIQIISCAMENINNKNIKIYKNLPFYSKIIPDINIRDYYNRLYNYINCDSYIYIVSLSYIDRYINNNPSISINIYTIHRLIMTSVIIALKYVEDNIYNNKYYSDVGGIELKEINKLEIEMLKGLNFDLSINIKKYEHQIKKLFS